METYQRGIWISSIILTLFALAGIVLGVVVLLFGSGVFASAGGLGTLSAYVVSGFLIGAAIIGIIQSVYQLIVGGYGIRGIDAPGRTHTLLVLAIIELISAAVALAFYAFNMGNGVVSLLPNVIGSIINVVTAAVLMFCTGRVRSGYLPGDVS